MARDESRFGANSDTPEGNPYADVAGSASRVDIAAVIHDDALIDAIASDGPITTSSTDEYQLAALLADWRAEINAVPIADTLDFDRIAEMVDREVAAVATMRSRTSARTGKVRYLRPLAGAAAAIAIVVGSLTAFSYQSSPGDPLWGIKSVAFSKQAESTVANIDSASALSEAQALVLPGKEVSQTNVDDARRLLATATESSAGVTDPVQRENLEEWLQQLQEQITSLLSVISPAMPVVIAPELPPVDAVPGSTDPAPVVTTDPVTPTRVPVTKPPVVVTPTPAPSVTTPVTPAPTVAPTTSPVPQGPTTTTASGPVGADFATTSLTAVAGS